MNRSLSRTLLFVLAPMPALLSLLLVLRYGVNMPYWDEWNPNIAGLLVKAHEHRLSVGDFLSQHNEHRLAVFRVIYLVLGLLTHGNTIAVMVAGWVVVCITSLGFLRLAIATSVKESDGPNRWAALEPRQLWGWFLCNLLLFSPVHAENWLSAMGLANVLPMCFIVWGLVVAGSRLRCWLKILLTVIFAILATYSAGGGVMAWPIIGAMLAFTACGKPELRPRLCIGTWCIVCAATMSAYLIGYHRSAAPAADAASQDAGSIIAYNFAFLGNSFTVNAAHTSLLLGICIAVILAASLAYVLHAAWRRAETDLPRQTTVWFLIAAYALLNGIFASYFRASLGIDQAISSRYAAFSMYGPVALVFIVPSICRDLRARVGSLSLQRLGIQAPAMLAGILLTLLLLGMGPQVERFEAARLMRSQGRSAILFYKLFPDNPRFSTFVTSDVPQIGQILPNLSRLGYFNLPLISSPNASELEIPSTALESYGALTAAERVGSDAVKVQGWAIDPIHKRPADSVVLTFDTDGNQPLIFIMADMGVERPDITGALKDNRYLKCGWIVTAPTGRIPPGLKLTQIRAWAVDGSTGRLHRLEKSFTLSR